MRKIEAAFYPKLSSILLMYLMLAHVFAAMCVYISIDGQWQYFLLFILFTSSILYFCHVTGVLSNQSVCSLEYIAKRRWRISLANGEIRDVELSGKTVLTKYFIILHFSDIYSSYQKSLLLFPDSLSHKKLQLLRRYVTVGFL